MSRPKCKRLIAQPPVMEGFRPFGIPSKGLRKVILLMEEFEAFRLVDHLGLTHAEAAIEMGISRPTLTRVYEKARQTIAEAFALGKAIIIEGGDYTMEKESQEMTRYCICPKCDTRVSHRTGCPCRQQVCPACGKKMVREGSYHHQLIIRKKGESNHEDRSTKQ
ncbi:MAG: DUF134 domain-containing protein [Bacteroidales bacterium]|nr:DUF134 domain-containing protein [Bacteroidales bacterium]